MAPLPQGSDREIFYPQWHCFCCHDSGLVQMYLVRLVVPNYRPDRDKWVMCQNPGCDAFSTRWTDPIENFDPRFTPLTCQKLDRFSRDDWRETVQRQVDIHQLAQKMKMPGSFERTENDNREALQRRQEVDKYDWAGASNKYFERLND